MKIDSTILDLVRQHNRILCISHVSPDGDAYGSLLGMNWILRHLGKEPVLAMHDRTPAEFRFLPGSDAILQPSAVADSYDLLICLDASSADRMGAVFRPQAHGKLPLLVIDHHVTNTRFGTVNWVAPECAATCQMLVYLAEALGVPLTGPLATCLLTGLVTDTLCFRTSNTTAAVMAAAMRLMEGGGNLADIVARTLNRRSVKVFQLWGQVLADLHIEAGVIWVTLSREQMQRASTKDDGQLSSLLVTASEANISATFTEKVDEKGQLAVECSFRAKPGFDVGSLAFELGGGGHPPASGCTLPGTLAEVSERVVALLKEAHQRQAAA
ncbi:MAG: bifunctional oligoribonuclease/PAP phosphatase NrnA [Caldilineaceae bacterium]|nr:bifunctional oligoribonuclease/PAP phosphatase NrnA [Caldilineaceae bacterium]